MFRNLAAEKARFGITNEQIGEVIGKSKDSVDKKMSGEVGFKLNEMNAIKNKFFPGLTLDYLFEEDTVAKDVS